MWTRIVLAMSCLVICGASSAALAEGPQVERSVAAKKVVVEEPGQQAVNESKEAELKTWLNGIKPAAGTNYWEKQVVRRSSPRKLDAGQE